MIMILWVAINSVLFACHNIQAFTILSITTSTRSTSSSSSSSSLYVSNTLTVYKNELLDLVSNTPSGRATPKQLTNQILNTIRQLEQHCPTPDHEVLSLLSGSWELLWTAQDPIQPESKRSWIINPIEDQSYSNNPEGRSNPFLPVGIQNRLEQMGIITSNPTTRRSTQAIDIKSGIIRNIVAIQFTPPKNPLLSMLQSSPSSSSSCSNQQEQRRVSLTVIIKFTPVQSDIRRVNVKFEECRISIPQINVNLVIPLPGIIGPTGWIRTVYIDHNLRITRGHKGSVFVLSRPRRATV